MIFQRDHFESDAFCYNASLAFVKRWIRQRNERPVFIAPHPHPFYEIVNRFTGRWVDDDKEFVAKIDIDRTELLRSNEEVPAGYLPTWIDAFPVVDSQRYIGVWTKQDVPKSWEYKDEMDHEALETKLAQMGSKGFRPTIINAYRDPQGGLRFLGVWVKDDVPANAFTRLTVDEYQQTIGELEQGWACRFVDSYTIDGETFYALIVTQDAQAGHREIAVREPFLSIGQLFDEFGRRGYWPLQCTID